MSLPSSGRGRPSLPRCHNPVVGSMWAGKSPYNLVTSRASSCHQMCSRKSLAPSNPQIPPLGASAEGEERRSPPGAAPPSPPSPWGQNLSIDAADPWADPRPIPGPVPGCGAHCATPPASASCAGRARLHAVGLGARGHRASKCCATRARRGEGLGDGCGASNARPPRARQGVASLCAIRHAVRTCASDRDPHMGRSEARFRSPGLWVHEPNTLATAPLRLTNKRSARSVRLRGYFFRAPYTPRPPRSRELRTY